MIFFSTSSELVITDQSKFVLEAKLFFLFNQTDNRSIMMLTHPDDWVTRESHAGNGAHDFSILGHSDTPTGAWKVSVWSFTDSVGVGRL